MMTRGLTIFCWVVTALAMMGALALTLTTGDTADQHLSSLMTRIWAPPVICLLISTIVTLLGRWES